MKFCVCKAFHVENGHILSKNPGDCSYPHGHSRIIEITLSSETLDENDMVCDFRALSLAIKPYLKRFDHALCVNSENPQIDALKIVARDRLLMYNKTDPTTEVISREIFETLTQLIENGFAETDAQTGRTYRIRREVVVENVRVRETPFSWAEYGRK